MRNVHKPALRTRRVHTVRWERGKQEKPCSTYADDFRYLNQCDVFLLNAYAHSGNLLNFSLLRTVGPHAPFVIARKRPVL